VHSGIDVAFESIMAQTLARGIGWIAWSWHGNSADIIQLDMTDDWEGPLNAWGQDVFEGPNGIMDTAEPASIFQ
jgi:mannan endo-1,4-beta-mannosidase